MPTDSTALPLPSAWSARSTRAFLSFASALTTEAGSASQGVEAARANALARQETGLSAAVYVLQDLADQGWVIRVGPDQVVTVVPPGAEPDSATEKHRVRRQELIKRDEQLSTPSVRRFVMQMERPREFGGRFVSIFSLMRDGSELAVLLRDSNQQSSDALEKIIDPYVQVISGGDERCVHTGLRLMDIWRYFRHTWSNQYTSTPGRTMLILVRDQAAEFHPVIGIAALGSAIVQIGERDRWIGWQPDELLAQMEAAPSLRIARWVARRLDVGRDEIYLDDLLADGLYWPALWQEPTPSAISRFEREAAECRAKHHRFVRKSELKGSSRGIDWCARAKSDLFRSKRCLVLAELLRARLALRSLLEPKPTARGLQDTFSTREGRRALASVVRRAKSEAVGTEIADLTVCGAVAPYNELLGGKLVSMIAVSPTVIRAYHQRYGSYASEIASSVAGRPITRRSHLVFIGTTSLYGSGSSQYNRVRIPKPVLNSDSDIVFQRLGKSKSFGTSHLSTNSLAALRQLSEQSRNGIRVNSIFGEGVNPKLRKVRDGLDCLGWPSEFLLQHGRQRILYGVSLVSNLLPYLLGIEPDPKYVFRITERRDVEKISTWWRERWLSRRAQSSEVLARVATHTPARPVCHGARVLLPDAKEGTSTSAAGQYGISLNPG